jgi:multidrug resistance efflux pump
VASKARSYFLPALALTLMGFALYHVVETRPAPAETSSPAEPPRSPFAWSIAGAGIVEARTENLAVGSPVAGVAVEVFARVGQTVGPGDRLFRLDDRALRAELQVRQAELAVFQAQLARLENLPRPEDLPASAARVREAQASLGQEEDRLKRTRELWARRAGSEEEAVHSELATRIARERLARARAEDQLLRVGAWERDKEVARATAVRARVRVEQVNAELERLVVRALVGGHVLQVNVRPGEYVGTPPGQPVIVMGGLEKLHVRVDIDEQDIPRFRPGVPARATPRGDAGRPIRLSFVRVEPFVIPKRSLTGANTEQVDTRVLQVVYALEDPGQAVYVGQQLDVFLDASAARPGDDTGPQAATPSCPSHDSENARPR